MTRDEKIIRNRSACWSWRSRLRSSAPEHRAQRRDQGSARLMTGIAAKLRHAPETTG